MSSFMAPAKPAEARIVVRVGSQVGIEILRPALGLSANIAQSTQNSKCKKGLFAPGSQDDRMIWANSVMKWELFAK